MGVVDLLTLLVFLSLASISVAAPHGSRNATPMAASSSSTTTTITTTIIPQETTSAQPTVQPATSPAGQSAQGPPPALLSNATADTAGGGVPGGPPPQTSFSPNAIANFRVANFIEGIESGFFASALQTLSKDPTFNNASADGKSIANVTTQIAAQELVHKATLEGLLQSVNQPAVPACANINPVADTNDFLAKANVVTSAAIGVIITITQSLAGSDGGALLGPLSSILSVESQQDTFFRMTGSNTPSASPFNTALSNAFAYNIALTYTNPRSCPQLLDLPIFPSLNVTSPVVGATAPASPPTSITFNASGDRPEQPLFIGWVNQANPVVYSSVTISGGVGTAAIPAGMTGMAFGALTAQNVAMTTEGLTNATIAGPAPVLMS